MSLLEMSLFLGLFIFFGALVILLLSYWDNRKNDRNDWPR